MPSLLDDIKYLYRHLVLPRRDAIRHIASSIICIFLIAVFLEVFVFNWNYFRTLDYQTVNLEEKIDLRKNADGYFRITEHNNTLEFNNLNTQVHNIALFMDPNQSPKNIDVKILFTDGAHHRYFDTTEYTEGIPIAHVSTYSWKSQYINLNSTGYMNSLSITFSGDIMYPILLSTVELNAHRPFIFVAWRFWATFGILMLIFAFRPRSSIYKISINSSKRASRAALFATSAIECLLVGSFVLFGSNLVGLATSTYNSGNWDGHSLVNTFEVAGDNAQQYAELAKSISEGHFYLDEEPPDWLKEMANPYDKGARDELTKETGQEALFDVAYHDGKYYVYFGVVPAIMFYLPFYLLTGQNFPTAIGIIIALFLYICGCSVLLDRFARYHFKKVSLGLILLMQIVLVSCSGILYLAKFPTFYSLPLACALAFSVWGIYFWMCGRLNRRGRMARRRVCYLAGSLCMALVLGCRPQLVVLSLLAIPLFWREYISKRAILTNNGALDFVCLIAPYLMVGASIMLYNHARFGSFFDFGANYNLTLNDMTQRGWILGRFAPAAFAYFLQTPCTTGAFPFLQAVPFDTTYMGQTIKEATYGGILTCCPILWVIFFAGPISRIRNQDRQTKTVTGVIATLVVSGVLVAMVDAQMAGILQRYYADFSFMFLSAAILLVFIANEILAPEGGLLSERGRPFGYRGLESGKRSRPISQIKHPLRNLRLAWKCKRAIRDRYESFPTSYKLLLVVLMAVSAISVAYHILLCFVGEVGWYSDAYPYAYQDILETISFWT